MGCDIHLYLEYRKPSEPWKLNKGRHRPGRDYTMFGYLAGVREPDVHQVAEVRGIPQDISEGTDREFYYYIRDDLTSEQREEKSENDEGNFCSSDEAKGWGTIINDDAGNPLKIQGPDWHTETWVSVEEFGEALIRYESAYDKTNKFAYGRAGEGYYEIYNRAKELRREGNEVRFVFWFDC